ncbi:ATP-binding protein [Candidatus Thiosymbion oneisti]|uniref:ATP-binding protein n=1 Tax=Candidatus Thiosymbion oneisti TaxID=589554 RepID=UPI000A8D0EBD|nr:ATP-binding protein [Candidatus Thiosymbion oneisti]
MPFPGGGADKVGNRYELRWTVRQFIRLLTGEATYIHLEPIGAEGEGIEFRLERQDGRIEAHQAKRQQAGKGHWTVADLARVGVLEGIRKHVMVGDSDFVFVSTQAPKSLPELRERAEIAADFPAFRDSLSLELTGDFDRLKQGLGEASDGRAWKALRRCRWTTLDERTLSDMVLALLDAHLTGNPRAALGVLALFALDAVYRRITPQGLWDHLEEYGILPSDVARDKNLTARAHQCRDDYLESQDFSIGGLELPRAEADKAVAALRDLSGSTKTIFLTGPAGIGKTGVTGQIVEKIAAAGWQVLPFRLDRLDPTQRPAEIGRQLLGREKSPVAILAGIANGRPCLLVIEQLDAVSVVSGRRLEVFDAVSAMVREARTHSNMRLLLVCRTFDLDHDHRLRDLRQQEKAHAESIAIGPLDLEQVQEAVSQLGLSSDRLTAKQIELLRLPLHLFLLAGVIREKPDQPVGFTSAKELYDKFWHQKRTDLLPALSDRNSFETLLYGLCDAINERQALSVPCGLFSSRYADLDALVSAHVVVRQGSRIGFFHESFFDYVFARKFCEHGQSLLAFLGSAEQDLFRRSQVRQILTYRRDDDFDGFDAYLDDLKSCLNAPEIRFHMKKLMIGVVGQVSDPRPEEWAILEDFLPERTGRLTDPVRDALWSSPAWFRFLHDQGVVTKWLADNRPKTRAFAFNWLGRSANAEPERVADLLEGVAGRSEAQDERILSVITRLGVATSSKRIEELFHRLASGSRRDWAFTCQTYHEFFDMYCHGSLENQRVACRALDRWLRLLKDDMGRADPSAHDPATEGVIADHRLMELVENVPAEFVAAVLDPFLELLETAAIREADPPFKDRIWYWGLGLPYRRLKALPIKLASALKQIAISSPDLFRTNLNRLRTSEYRTAHVVLLRALVIEGGAWKSFAVDYLEETWSHWGLWYGDQELWDCRCLLQTLAPHLDEKDIARLEPWILNRFERWRPSNADELAEGIEYIRSQACWFRWHYGTEQFTLLGALPQNKLSRTGKRRLAELSRKASSLDWKLERPYGIRDGTVISPLSDQAIARMTDDQWLSAIDKYADDKKGEWLEDRVLGGARELSQALEKQTKAQPERFARLMLDLPDATNEHYFEAIVRGLENAGLATDLLGQVVERAHNRPGRPHGRWLPSTIASHGDQDLPHAMLEVIAWYATQDPDPVEELWRKDSGANGPYYGGNPHFHGINSVRGSAASAIANLIAKDSRYWEYFAPVLESMVTDPSLAVRTCVAEACIQALRYDRPQAIALFLRLCETEEELLASPMVEYFLYYTADTEYAQVRPILERMLASSIPVARQGAAQQTVLAALSNENARSLAATVIHGDPESRKGAAEILSHNLLTAPDRAYCEALLIGLFGDPDPEVCRTAGQWTWPIKDERRIGTALPVVEALIESRAFSENADSFFDVIEEAVDVPPDLLFRAGQRFIETVESATGDTGHSSALAAQGLSNLILRAYRQAEQDSDLRRRCLDLFDQLLEVGGYGADTAIETFER